MRSARQGSKLFTRFFEFGIVSLNLGFIAQHFCNVYLFENEHLFLYTVWEPQSLYILSSEGGLNKLGTTYMSQACISLATVI